MNKLYLEDIKNAIKEINKIDKLKNKAIFITGANGMIGSFIIDLLMFLNETEDFSTTVIANGRNKEKLETRFSKYINSPLFDMYIGDINSPITFDGNIDYIINCASNTHPKQYSSDPIGTIMTNIEGTNNVLQLATKTKAKMVFLSSVEIYGENIYNVGKFKENMMGYIDCNTMRAGYNEAKRAGEALCQSYKEKNGIELSIVRLPRIYGPTVKKDDSKVIFQFINKALNNEDIVLKSKGDQYFSYLYIADTVGGILNIMINGENGEVYNLGNEKSDIHLSDLAKIIANNAGRQVVFDLPDEIESKGFSKATDARLDYTKVKTALNWIPQYSIEEGIDRTIKILKEENK